MEYNKKQYEEELKRKQKEHLEQIKNNENWRPCLHDQCPECVGTGTKKDGTICIHNLYCNCPKCAVTYFINRNVPKKVWCCATGVREIIKII